MHKRALRRHHRQRLMRKRRKYHLGWAGETPRNLGRVVSTPKACNCVMCHGNWERSVMGHGTIQEQKADLTYREQLVTLDEEMKDPVILG